MAVSELSERLAALCAGHDEVPMPERPELGVDAALAELVYSLLLEDSTNAQALSAMGKIAEAFHDLNELRVSLSSEIADVLGKQDRRREERAQRLRVVLTRVFELENGLSLSRLGGLGKRESRAVLESIPDLPAFCVGRVMLLVFGAHAFPLDQRLFDLLQRHEIAGDEEDALTLSGRLERAVRAGEAKRLYLTLEGLAEQAPSARGARSRSRSTARASKKSKAAKR